MRPAFALFAALMFACGSPPAALPAPRVLEEAAVSADLAAGEEEISMEIVELMCSPCAADIVRESRRLPGVTHVSMVMASKTLILRFDTAKTDRGRVIASVEEIVANIQ